MLTSGKVVHIAVTANKSVHNPELFVSIKPKVSAAEESQIKTQVSFMFSIEDDLTAFYSLAKKDAILKHAIKDLYGLKVQTTPTLFEGLVIGFCLQWVSFQRGVQMMDCLIRRFGERVNEAYAFPVPEALAKATLKELRECKLGFRAERIKWISEKVTQGLDLEEFKSLPDAQLRKELVQIKWIGAGTAEALLLWRFKRYSAFPLDVWSAKVFQAFYPKLKGETLDAIKRFAEDRWGKYRGLAYYYLMCGRKNLAKKLNVKLALKWSS